MIHRNVKASDRFRPVERHLGSDGLAGHGLLESLSTPRVKLRDHLSVG
jgi:hypothetical protein